MEGMGCLPLDCLGAMEGHRGDMTDARFRQGVENEERAQYALLQMTMARIEASCWRVKHAADPESGLIPDVRIPLMAYHHWAAKFKMRDMKAGIRHTTGYECWEDPAFVAWWKKRNPGMVVQEEKRCAQRSIIVPATRWSKVRKEGLAA